MLAKITKIAQKRAGVVVRQRVRFGKPTIRGTRIAVTDLLSLLHAGYRLDEIPGQYPGVTLSDAEAGIRYASRVLGKEEILEIGIN